MPRALFAAGRIPARSAARLTFDRCGDSDVQFTDGIVTVFVRRSANRYAVLTVTDGEPLSGNQYDTFATPADALTFLSARSFSPAA